MTNRTAKWLFFAGIGLRLASAPIVAAPNETNSLAPTAGQAAEDKEACSKNLRAIYAAIEAYRADHRDLPNWLSDLVPQYLADANVLVCPVSRRTGQSEAGPLADPKVSASYLFEFCPLPLGAAATNAPARTRREWKRRQMGLVGSIVPLVRCRQHQPVLNLAFDGRIYESPPMWETIVTNRVSLAELSPTRLFAEDTALAARTARNGGPPRFPPRAPKARKELLDLGGFYNARLGDPWQGKKGNDLAALPQGLQTFAGVEFDVRGIVRLGSQSPSATRYPAQAQGIKVRQKSQRLHFLHAAAFGTAADEGKQIGAYVVHFATNNMRLEIPIIYGRDVRDWHTRPGERAPTKELKVAWTGENGFSKQTRASTRLFLTTWINLLPAVEIESIDFVSSMGTPAPFLLGITLDNSDTL